MTEAKFKVEVWQRRKLSQTSINGVAVDQLHKKCSLLRYCEKIHVMIVFKVTSSKTAYNNAQCENGVDQRHFTNLQLSQQDSPFANTVHQIQNDLQAFQ